MFRGIEIHLFRFCTVNFNFSAGTPYVFDRGFHITPWLIVPWPIFAHSIYKWPLTYWKIEKGLHRYSLQAIKKSRPELRPKSISDSWIMDVQNYASVRIISQPTVLHDHFLLNVVGVLYQLPKPGWGLRLRVAVQVRVHENGVDRYTGHWDLSLINLN